MPLGARDNDNSGLPAARLLRIGRDYGPRPTRAALAVDWPHLLKPIKPTFAYGTLVLGHNADAEAVHHGLEHICSSAEVACPDEAGSRLQFRLLA